MTERERLLRLVCASAKRALLGQTPVTLRAYSFALDHEQKQIRLRAHFAEEPSEDDLDMISIIETEIDADFLDHFEGDTDTEIAPPGTNLAFLADGIAYLRSGEPGQVCNS